MEFKRVWDTVEKPFQVIITQEFAPNKNVWIGFRVIPSSPHYPTIMLWPQRDSFTPMLLKIQHLGGGGGGGGGGGREKVDRFYYSLARSHFNLYLMLPLIVLFCWWV